LPAVPRLTGARAEPGVVVVLVDELEELLEEELEELLEEE
jgi:hypothetical protein